VPKNLLTDLPIIGPIIAGQQASNTAQSAQGAQAGDLANADTLASDLAGTNWVNPVLEAGKSGVNTFASEAGGVPNIGAMIESLFGTNMENAMQVGANQRSTNLEGAIRGFQGSGQQYNQIGQQAGAAAGAASTQAGGQIAGLPWGTWFPGSTPGVNIGAATGVGSSGKASDPLSPWNYPDPAPWG